MSLRFHKQKTGTRLHWQTPDFKKPLNPILLVCFLVFLKLRGASHNTSLSSLAAKAGVLVFEGVIFKLNMRKTCCLAPVKPCHELAETLGQKHYAGEGVQEAD